MPNGRFLWTAHAIKLNVIERALIKYALFRALENALDWRLARCVIILNNTDKNLLVNCVLMQRKCYANYYRDNNENVIMLWYDMILVFLQLQCFVFGFVFFLL